MVTNRETYSGRTGKQDRMNPDRYFHVMGQGWYALAREGVIGPYLTKEMARESVQEQISGLVPERNKESWRYKPV